MDPKFDIAVLVGSLRKDSFNLKLAKALTTVAPENLTFRFVDIGGLPLYNPDLDGDTPPGPWAAFREEIQEVDAILFVTPEYNRSIPASLKNAIDVGSRPMGKSVWNGKPAAIATGSPGGIGGFGANHILRQSLVFLNVPAMQQPEAYIGGIASLFDDKGGIAKPETTTFLTNFMTSYAAWVNRHVDR